MFKRGVCFILLCCFINTLTTLPGRCCSHALSVHAQGNSGKPHSFTVLEFIFEQVLDMHDAGDGDDSYCLCFTSKEACGTSHTQEAKQAPPASVPQPVLFESHAIIVNRHNARQFALPPHYNYLFRLTPF